MLKRALLQTRRPTILLLLAALVPLSLFSVVVSFSAIGWQQAATDREAMLQVRLLIERTDRTLDGYVRDLKLLGHSRNLDNTARLDAFLVIARRYLDEIKDWSGVRLSDPAGRVLLDTSSSIDDVTSSGERSPLPPGSLEGHVVLSGVLPTGPVPVGRPRVIVVSVPVMREGRVVYVLSATITTARLDDLVSSARQKEGWRPFLVDKEGRVVAAPSVPQAVGFLILPAGREARDEAVAGTYSSKTPSGEETLTTFARSSNYGWSAHVGIPLSIYAAPTLQLRLALIGAALVTAALTAAFVVLFKREYEMYARRLGQQEHALRLEALGRVTGGVAHDFNNLLAVILGNLHLIKKGVRTGARAEALVDTALMAAERGAALTHRLLSISRKQELRPREVGVAATFEAVTRMAAQSFTPDIVLRTSIASDVDGVLVDPVQFEAALLNLCTNARDAMPAGGTIELTARVETLDAARDGLVRGRYVVVSVTDSGIGMDRVTQRKALEPYFSTKGDKGTGLGLSSAQGFTRQSGGDLTVTSELGKGTTVELWLKPAVVARELRAPATTEAVAGPLDILVVDDDPLVALSTTSLLADLGHAVVEAGSARDAVTVLSARHVDFVITDYRMPGMSGVALAREVRRRWPSLPILIYTGFADVPERERAEFTFLSKPASAAEFARLIAQNANRRGDCPDGSILHDRAC